MKFRLSILLFVAIISLVATARADDVPMDHFVYAAGGPTGDFIFDLPAEIPGALSPGSDYFTTYAFANGLQYAIIFALPGNADLGGSNIEMACDPFIVNPVAFPFFFCDFIARSSFTQSLFSVDASGDITFNLGSYPSSDAPQLTITPEPEPPTLTLLLSGVVLLTLLLKHRF